MNTGRRPHPDPPVCCDLWTTFRYRTRPWAVLHELAHSRIPFSVTFLAEQTEIDATQAEAMCRKAEVLQWVTQPHLDGDLKPGVTALYVGQLTRKR